MKIIANHYRLKGPHLFTMENGVFTGIEPDGSGCSTDLWIGPGLCDVQVNGFGGVDFNNPINAEEWILATDALLKHGCTHFLPTFVTNTEAHYRQLLEGIEAVRHCAPRNFRGYHFEGPFLNPAFRTRGAHHEGHICGLDEALVEEWEETSNGGVRVITLAPEVDLEKVLGFIRRASDRGIRISMGHSEAPRGVIDAAVEAGATCWTHFGNAIGGQESRFENVLFNVLGGDLPFASLIPDGIHIPPRAFKVIARCLGERLLLTTDAMAGAAARPGTYKTAHHFITLGEDRVARTEAGTLAGSTQTPFDGVFKAAEMAALPWEVLWEAFSVRPAAWLGLRNELTVGCEASFCLFELLPSPRLRATFLEGRMVYEG